MYSFKINNFFKNTLIITTGTVLSQIIGILFTPFLTRVYTPIDYGQLAIFASISTIISSLISLRYEIQIVKSESKQESINLVLLIIFVAFILSIFFSLIAFLLGDSNIIKNKVPSLNYWLNYCIISSFFLTSTTAIISWLHREKKYVNMSLIRVFQTLLSSIISLFFGYYSFKKGLLMGVLIGNSFSFLMLLILFFQTFKNYKIEFKEILNTALKFKKTPIFLLPTAMLDAFTLQAPIFLISLWFAIDKTGNYRMATSLLTLPVVVIGGAFSQVFFQEFSSCWPDKTKCLNLLIKTWKILATLSIIPLGLIMFFGVKVFTFFLGPSWYLAGYIASLLAPMTFFSLIHSATSTSLIVLGKEKLILFFGIAVLIYRPAAIYIGHKFNNFYLGIILFSIFEIFQILIFQILVFQNLKKNDFI